jgi:undecaprenyl-diphosphatase
LIFSGTNSEISSDIGIGFGREMQPERLQQPRTAKPLFVGIVLLGLYILTAAFVRLELVQNLDNQVAIAINAALGAGFSEIMYLASIYGREGIWIPVVILMIALGKPRTKLLGIELAILFVLGIIFGTLAQDIWYRPRPFMELSQITLRVPKETDTSFPSGHATIVSLGSSFLLWKYLRSSQRAKVAAVLLTIEAAIVCYSRVYNGVHFPTDVIAGIFLGGAVTFIGGFLLERYLITYLKKAGSLAERITRVFRLPQPF